jgi:hypothetical protein
VLFSAEALADDNVDIKGFHAGSKPNHTYFRF